MQTICPHCLKTIDVESLAVGSRFACPECQREFHVSDRQPLLRTLMRDRASESDQSDTISGDGIPSQTEVRAAATIVSQQRLGRFVLFDVAGSGGFGDVYRGYDTDLGRVVAIKVPRAAILEHPERLERVHREARSAARLHHPSIVAVLEWGEERGLPYIVYEFISGQTLSQILHRREHSPDWRQAAVWIRDIARGLDYAHAQGVVHRDVKPQNIMIDDEGLARLTDFGLARLEAVGEESLTKTGAVMGTAAYMSPEQARGQTREVGPHSDIYSLGATLYELLSGRRPFSGNAVEILHRAAYEEAPRLESLSAAIPADLAAICHRAMEKQKETRYRTAGDMAEDLDCWLQDRPVRVRRIGPVGRMLRWCRRNRAVAASIAAVVGTLAVATVIVSLALRDSLRSLAVARRRLADSYVQKAAVFDDDDVMLSLPWAVAAARLDRDDPDRRAVHRLRLDLALRQLPDPVAARNHGSRVRYVSPASADSRRFLLTAGSDRSVCLWDCAETDGPVFRGKCSAEILHCAISAGGTYAAAADESGQIWIWDSRSGAVVASLRHGVSAETRAADGQVTDMRFRPGQAAQNLPEQLVTAHADGAVCIWDVRTGRLLSTLPHDAAVTEFSFDVSGGELVTVRADRVVGVWELLLDGTPVSSEPSDVVRFRRAVHSAELCCSGERLLTVFVNGTPILWNRQTDQEDDVVLPEPDGFNNIALSPDRCHAAVWYREGGRDFLEIRDLLTGVLVSEMREPPGQVDRLLFLTEESIAAIRDGRVVDVLQMKGDRLVRSCSSIHHDASVAAVRLSRKDLSEDDMSGELTVCRTDGMVRTWHLPGRTSQNLVGKIAPDGDTVQVTASESCVAVVVHGEDALYVSDRQQHLRQMECDEETDQPHQGIHAAVPASDGRQVVVSRFVGNRRDGFRGRLTVYDTTTGRLAASPIMTPAGLIPRHDLEIDAGSRYLMATCSGRGAPKSVMVWRLPEGRLIWTDPGPVEFVRWSNRPGVLCVVSDSVVRFVTVDGGENLATLPCESPPVGCAVSADELQAVLVSADEILVWNPEQDELRSAPRLESAGRTVGLSVRAGLLALTDRTRVTVFDLRSPDGVLPVCTVPSVDHFVSGRLSPDGRYLLTVDPAGSARLWNVADGAYIGRVGPAQVRLTKATFFGASDRVLLQGHLSSDQESAWVSVESFPGEHSGLDRLVRQASIVSRRRIGDDGTIRPADGMFADIAVPKPQ